MLSVFEKYFEKHEVCRVALTNEHLQAQMVVVIPCYDEDYLFDTLQSLEFATPIKSKICVIVVVNSSELTPQKIIDKNLKIFADLESVKHNYRHFSLLPIWVEGVRRKYAGVGNARKIGMDTALRIFESKYNLDGVIVSLDADTLVSHDFFQVIESHFKNHQNKALVYEFEHRTTGNADEYKACLEYEKYLHYYRKMLQQIGFPHDFYTMGCDFSVRAESYMKVGGMPQKQGGEDFYFLHKVAQTTEIKTIEKVLVYPSARVSTRVPFGTGQTVSKIMQNGVYKGYKYESFMLLKSFYAALYDFAYNSRLVLDEISPEVLDFIGHDTFVNIVEKCKNTTKNPQSLYKKLIAEYDGFFILKFLNYISTQPGYEIEEMRNL